MISTKQFENLLGDIKTKCREGFTAVKDIKIVDLYNKHQIPVTVGKEFVSYLKLQGIISESKRGPKGTYWLVNHDTVPEFVAKQYHADLKNGVTNVKHSSTKPKQFNLGEKLYFVTGDRIRRDKIISMKLDEHDQIMYSFKSGPQRSHFEVFSTVEEVIVWLKKNIVES